jgi:two-component sensor histidine kinase
MDDDAARVHNLLRQQAAIAGFGSFALRQTDLLKVLTEAARVCADGLSVPFCKVCRYREDENDLLIEAGHGWKAGVVGHVVSRADESSPQGRAFVTGQPSICNDLRKDNQFKLPPFYADHGIVSTVDVVIKGGDRPYGVLEIDNSEQHDYDQHDIDFLTGFANVLAEAVATSARTAVLRTTIEQMAVLVDEKDRLLDQKKILAEELQHRVRNNLQLVYGMMSKQLDDTADESGKRGLKAIARRVSTLAQVYDHLLGNEMTRTTDFGGYVQSLCNNIAEIQAAPEGGVTLSCASDTLILDLDVVTALGIAVAELVTNAYDHAFPGGKGSAAVSVHGPANGDAMATMTISDSGRGFEAKDQDKRHGLGLVRRLVEQVRGTAAVESSDRGTVWTIRFPIVNPVAHKQSTPWSVAAVNGAANGAARFDQPASLAPESEVRIVEAKP